MTVPPALVSHESTEHYTPQYIIDAVIACMGAINLDPCSNSREIPNVPAARHYTAQDNGIAWSMRRSCGVRIAFPVQTQAIEPAVANRSRYTRLASWIERSVSGTVRSLLHQFGGDRPGPVGAGGELRPPVQESSPERKLPRYWKTAKISRLKVKVPACDQGSMGRPGGNREPAVNWKIEYSSFESDRPR
jgi:hypothetical protein